MVDMPERIWAFQSDGGQRGWLHTQPPQAIIDIPTAYVRADLFDALTEERDRLKEELERQAGLLEMTSEGWAKQLADVLAERDKAREYGAEARILGTKADDKRIHEQHRASVAEAERDRLALANAELLAAFDDLMSWFPDKPTEPMWQMKAGEWGADAAIDEARALLTKHKATSTEPEGE